MPEKERKVEMNEIVYHGLVYFHQKYFNKSMNIFKYTLNTLVDNQL